jgi:hypothetical protein
MNQGGKTRNHRSCLVALGRNFRLGPSKNLLTHEDEIG